MVVWEFLIEPQRRRGTERLADNPYDIISNDREMKLISSPIFKLASFGQVKIYVVLVKTSLWLCVSVVQILISAQR